MGACGAVAVPAPLGATVCSSTGQEAALEPAAHAAPEDTVEMDHGAVGRSDDVLLVVRFSGQIDAGSEGSADAAAGSRYVTHHLTDQHAALVLDCAELDYVWGNYVGGWFVPAIRRGIPARFVAVGRTATALGGLLADAGLEFVLGDPCIHPSVDAALESLSG